MFQITQDVSIIRTEIEQFLSKINETALSTYLQMSDFYEAPASVAYHGNTSGGLCIHSYAVGQIAAKLAVDFSLSSPVIALTSQEFGFFLGLVHDLCKVNFYSLYKKNVKDEQGNWTSINAYKVRDSHKSYGHGFTSYYRLTKLISDPNLVEAAMYPVLYHMGGYDVSQSAEKGYQKAQKDYPWLTLLQSADLFAGFIYGV